VSGVRLDAIVARLAEVGSVVDAARAGDGSVVVDDAFHDSSEVRPGSLFCCVVGRHADGHDHAAAAVAAGAAALLVERPLDLGVPEIQVPDVRAVLGPVASVVHGDPSRSLRVVGVTGTNGKTSTVAILSAVLTEAGLATTVIGTLTGARTTPEATDLARQLAVARDDGRSVVAMEVSSHALAQGRVTGTHFALAVFTNLSPDHLDFHGSMAEYFRAKARLFEPDLTERAVVNTDDPNGRLLFDAAAIPTTGFSAADATSVTSTSPLVFDWHGAPVRTALAGRFNLDNALAAAAAAEVLGLSDDDVRRGLEAARPVPGRFEPVEAGQPFAVIVDFAHTPGGLERVLEAARDAPRSHRVLLVFGAGGDRDPSKRPLMGAAAERGADLVVITNDNPRHEQPSSIADAIRAGMADPSAATVELDRRVAIGLVLDAARPGDVVVLAGKGHETTQTIGDDVRPFDDRAVARELLAERGWSS
jgi:UDP-N-acetylmuramoyl-L-alanyl-D-glutamate--2,6-diaminopimelate ligase